MDRKYSTRTYLRFSTAAVVILLALTARFVLAGSDGRRDFRQTAQPPVTEDVRDAAGAVDFDPEQLALGEDLFQRTAGGIGCQYCHGVDARGNIGPNILGKSPEAIMQALGTVQMMEIVTNLDQDDIQAVAVYLAYLQQTTDTGGTPAGGDASAAGGTAGDTVQITIPGQNRAAAASNSTGTNDTVRIVIPQPGAGTTATSSAAAGDTVRVIIPALTTAADGDDTPEIDGDAENGEALFISTGCSACHNTASDDALVGPGLLTVAERAADRIEELDAVEYIRRSILEPTAFVVEGFAPVMPTFGTLTADDVNDLIAYVFALNAAADDETADDVAQETEAPEQPATPDPATDPMGGM